MSNRVQFRHSFWLVARGQKQIGEFQLQTVALRCVRRGRDLIAQTHYRILGVVDVFPCLGARERRHAEKSQKDDYNLHDVTLSFTPRRKVKNMSRKGSLRDRLCAFA